MTIAKRMLAALLAAVMLLAFAACGEESSKRKDKKDDDEGTADIGGTSSTSLTVGGLVTVPGKAEFYVDFCQLAKDVRPPKPEGAYSYYEGEDGKVYIDLCLGFKNLGTEEVSADDIFECEVLYDGSYEYTTFEVAEDDNRGSLRSYKDLSPLSNEYVHIISSVPEEVQTSGKPLMLTIKYEGKKYTFDVRNNITGQVSVAPPQSSGAQTPSPSTPAVPSVQAQKITDKQVITHNGKCEFYVDFCNVSVDVRPPVTEGAYSYYKGEEGKVYIDLCICYKNLETSSVSVEDITDPTVTYAGAYKYDGFVAGERDGRTSINSYVDFDPLTTEYMHLIVQVPEEVQTSGQSVEVFFNIAGTDYCYKVK